MKTFVLSPTGKQPIKIANNIDLSKGQKPSDLTAFAKSLRGFLTLKNIALVACCIIAPIDLFSAVVYDSTGSNIALGALVASSLLELLALAPLLCDNRYTDVEL